MENFHRRETHALKDSAMVGTNALAPNADIANVQEWLGHANIATTRLVSDHRVNSFKINELIS